MFDTTDLSNLTVKEKSDFFCKICRGRIMLDRCSLKIKDISFSNHPDCEKCTRRFVETEDDIKQREEYEEYQRRLFLLKM